MTQTGLQEFVYVADFSWLIPPRLKHVCVFDALKMYSNLATKEKP